MHTVEIVAISAVSVAVAFHAFRFIGGKMAARGGAVGQAGRSLLGVFSFGSPQ